MNDASPRSADIPPNVEPTVPDPIETPHRPEPDGGRQDPREHPLIELPPRTEPEMPAKPQRDLPYADPQRAGAEIASDDTDPDDAAPPDTDPVHQPWQAPYARSPWMTQPLKAMPLPIPTMPLPFRTSPR